MTNYNKHPYLSVVIVSRNDDHGANMYRRTYVCVIGMIEQLERNKIPSELVFVEWLPPSKKPLLKDIFPWPKGLVYCKIRVLVVPSSSAIDYQYSENYSIRDLTPWNVGIRRAKGEFVLSTVTDVLLSNELVAFFSKKKLDPKAMYRIDRCDVDRKVLALDSLKEQLIFCRENIIDKHTLNPLKFIFKRKIPILHDKAPGDFILMSRTHWQKLHGFPQGINCGADTLLIYMAYISGLRQVILKQPIQLFHIDHDSIWKRPAYTYLRKKLIKMKVPFQIVDILSRFGDLMPLKSQLEKKNIKLFSSQNAKEIITEMLDNKRSYVFNKNEWGFGDKEIHEFIVGE